MKILLLTTYHPLAQHIGARRWAALSEELASRNHFILQLSSNRLLPHSLSNVSKSVHLHSNNYQSLVTPYPCLYSFKSRILSFLRSKSVNSRTLPWAANANRPNQILYGAHSFLSIIKSLLNNVFNLIFLNRIREEKAWAIKAFNQHIAHVVNFNPDLIIASYPLWGPTFLAEKFSEYLDIPFLLDVRDPISRDIQLPSSLSNLYEKIETLILNKAIAVLCINPTVATFLAPTNGLHQKLCICPNPVNINSRSNEFYSLANLRYKNPLATGNSLVRLCYFGTIHTQSLAPQYLTTLAKVDALAKANFCIQYFGRDFQKLSSFFPATFNNRLNNFGYLNLKEEYSTIADNADFFILASFPGPLGKCVMTGKIFDYIPFGKPVVALCQKDDELSKLILKSRIGICFFSVDEILEAFLDMSSLVSTLSKSYCPDLDYLKGFCVDQVALKIDKLITSSV